MRHRGIILNRLRSFFPPTARLKPRVWPVYICMVYVLQWTTVVLTGTWKNKGSPDRVGTVRNPKKTTTKKAAERKGREVREHGSNPWMVWARRYTASGELNHPTERFLVLPLFLAQLPTRLWTLWHGLETSPTIPPGHSLLSHRLRVCMVVGARMRGITRPAGRVFSFRLDDQFESRPVRRDLVIEFRGLFMTCDTRMSGLQNLLAG
jgi:hypothetical protein